MCEIGLFRRLPGTSLFSQRIGPGTAVELGEEVQLRSIVRGNDGKYLNRSNQYISIIAYKQAGSIQNSPMLSFDG